MHLSVIGKARIKKLQQKYMKDMQKKGRLGF